MPAIPNTMFETAALARAKGVARIGRAHPGFADLAGFGRRIILGHGVDEIERMVAHVRSARCRLSPRSQGARFTHAEAARRAVQHGRPRCENLALAIGRAIAGVDRSLVYAVVPGRPTEAAARALNLPLAREAFADRTYDDDGNLASRNLPGSVIHDAQAGAVARAADAGGWRDHHGRRASPTGRDRHDLRAWRHADGGGHGPRHPRKPKPPARRCNRFAR
jgi:UPF0271 protein